MDANLQGIAHQDAKEIAVTLELITPERARCLLETMPYRFQRNVSRKHVAQIAREIEAGRFPAATQIRVAHFGDRSFLIDGQHRLTAVAQGAQSVLFTLTEELAPSHEYIAWVYGTLDTGRRRNFGDLQRPLELTEELDLPQRSLKDLSSAVDVLWGGLARPHPEKRPTLAEKVHMVRLYAPYMKQFTEVARGASGIINTAIRRSYVVCVAVLMFRYGNTATATEFWKGALFDDGLSQHDPRKRAHVHLLATKMASTSINNSRNTKLVTIEYGSRYLLAAFRKHMNREPTKMEIKVVDPTAPIQERWLPSNYEDWRS